MSVAARPAALVVDDSASMRSIACAALVELGLDAREAQDGADAWRVLRDGGRFDLVLTDLHMPHVDGLKLVALIRSSAEHRDTAVIVMTAEGTEADLRRAIELGATAVLRKPLQRAELAAAVRRVLQRRQR